jgi:hypothetical protein
MSFRDQERAETEASLARAGIEIRREAAACERAADILEDRFELPSTDKTVATLRRAALRLRGLLGREEP